MAVERFNRATVSVGTDSTVVLNAHATGDTIVITGRASTSSGSDQTLTLFINGLPVQSALVGSNETVTLDGDKLVMKAGDVLSAQATGDVDVYVAALEREGGAGSADAAATAAQSAVAARNIAQTKAAEAVISAQEAHGSSQSAASSAATALQYATGGLVRVDEDDSGIDYIGAKIEGSGVITTEVVDYSGSKKLAVGANLSAYATSAYVDGEIATVEANMTSLQQLMEADIDAEVLILNGDISTVTGLIGTVQQDLQDTNNDLVSRIATVDAKIQPAVAAGIQGLVGAAPAALDTLTEIAAAINDDANYAATITGQLATKVENSTFTAGLAGKADASSVYTRSETDTQITNAVNSGVASAIATERTTSVAERDALQAEIDALESRVDTLETQVASALASLSNLQSQITTNANNLTNNVNSLQTQINAKAPKASPAFTGTVTCTGDIIAYN